MVLLQGDCLLKLSELSDSSIDSIVTDPPYGLSFMRKKWDYDVPSVDIWKECLRVLKPGGHLLAFGGTRTYHRLAVNIEDAGFEIRDQIQWLYGQGFPKSQDISKAIDKQAGAEREVLGVKVYGDGHVQNGTSFGRMNDDSFVPHQGGFLNTAPSTPEAKQWSGWGTALKPANEPICLARKPLSEKTIAKNVLKHGTGGLNIEGSRVGISKSVPSSPSRTSGNSLSGSKDGSLRKETGHETGHNPNIGRFPSNVLLDEGAAAALDEQSGQSPSNARKNKGNKNPLARDSQVMATKDGTEFFISDTGGASRFFYCAKASKRDRGEGNSHPTVKPVKLMEYLIRLITPEGGTVLDPFMGSGSTGVAAKNLGFSFLGIEISKEYMAIAESRIGA